ncbi:unnamed protein product [Discula destructiva]
MYFTTLSIALFASLSLAQFQGLPTCAQDCAGQQFSGGSYAGCGTDPKCICDNDAFLSNIACCLIGACNAADQSSAITFATQICSAQGVAVPTVVTCATAENTATAGVTSAPTAAVTSAPTSAATGTAATGTAVTASGSTAGAWAPRQTAAMGMEMLGLAAAGAGLVFL